VDACVASVGSGKGGGKADQANGIIPGGTTALAGIVTAASQYGSKFGTVLTVE
jgi:hypothetical protein